MDYKGAAQSLQNAGYATDPQYASKLIQIIETYELWQYDKEAKTAMPDWFLQEFGAGALQGLVNEPSGDVDFWRNTAVSLRAIKSAKK